MCRTRPVGGEQGQQEEIGMRRWRKMTWALLAWTGFFVYWFVAAINGRASKGCATDPDVLDGTMSLSACQTASDVGTGIGAFLVGFLWFLGFMVLSTIWFMSRPKQQVVLQQVPSTE